MCNSYKNKISLDNFTTNTSSLAQNNVILINTNEVEFKTQKYYKFIKDELYFSL